MARFLHAFAMTCKDLLSEAHCSIDLTFSSPVKNKTDMQLIINIYVDRHWSQGTIINKSENFGIWGCHSPSQYFFLLGTISSENEEYLPDFSLRPAVAVSLAACTPAAANSNSLILWWTCHQMAMKRVDSISILEVELFGPKSGGWKAPVKSSVSHKHT